MPKSIPHSRLDTLIIAATALVAAVLCALAMSWYHDRSHRWIRIVTPPDEVVTEIVALNRAAMPYVKTQQGNLFFCSGSTWRDACRQITPAELPISEVHPKWLTCEPPFPETPPAPGTIIDAFEVGQCAEARTYSKVVLLSDGALWQWRRTFSWVQPFTIASAGIAGLVLGLMIGAGFVDMRRYLRTPSPAG